MKNILFIRYLYVLWCIIITTTEASEATKATRKTAVKKSLEKFKDSKISRIYIPQFSESLLKFHPHNQNYHQQHHLQKQPDQSQHSNNIGNALQKPYNGKISVTSTMEKKKSLTNQDLMQTLGLKKLSPSHQRKRLAIESRHHTSPDDSKMFVIKLPPNPYYYGNNHFAHSKNSIDGKNEKVPVDFRSNGKPRRIYHWNIPYLKKIVNGNSMSGRHTNLRSSNDISELIDIKNIPTWSNPWENDTIEKTYTAKYDKSNKHRDHVHDNIIEEKNYKKNAPEYYAPIRPKKNSFQNYFANNGKPKTFYVIKKNQKPYYRKLIP